VTASQVALAAIITCKQKLAVIYKYSIIFLPAAIELSVMQLSAFISGIPVPDTPVNCNSLASQIRINFFYTKSFNVCKAKSLKQKTLRKFKMP
jgi:hypothetical protein